MAYGNKTNKIIQVDVSGEVSGKLDSFNSKLGEEVAQRKQLRSNITVASERKKPVVTFLDDDTRSGVYTRLKPIFESRNVPCSVACITGRFDDPNHVNLSQLHELEDLGWEVMGHTFTHPTGNNGLQEYIGDYEKLEFEIGSGCKEVLENEGFQVDGFVYPQGGHSYDIREITKKNYTYAFAGLGINDKELMDSMVINRIGFGFSAENNPTIKGNSELNTLAYYKACVDYAVENDGWLVFMTHVDAQSATDDQILGDLIDYIKSINVDILTGRDAYKIHGNRYFAGDVEAGKYFIVNKDNEVIQPEGFKLNKIESNSKPASDSITTFPNNSITFMRTSNSFASSNNLPTATAGFLITYKLDESGVSYNRQEYWPYLFNQKFIRVLDVNNGSWKPWDEYVTASRVGLYVTDVKVAKISVPQIVVPANSAVDTTITLSGVKSSKTQISGNPTYGLNTGLMFNVMILADNQITIRIHNLNATESTITPRSWAFQYVINT